MKPHNPQVACHFSYILCHQSNLVKSTSSITAQQAILPLTF